MAQSTFDAAAFEATVIEAANETHMTPVPEDDYVVIIDKVRIKTIAVSKGDRAGQEVPVLELILGIVDEDGKLAKLMNREKITLRHDIWLEVNEHGGLAFGPNQNVQLGRLREACNLNKPGKPFSYGMLEGQGPLHASVTQTEPNEAGDVYNRITRLQKAA